jgi:hypothetical protein
LDKRAQTKFSDKIKDSRKGFNFINIQLKNNSEIIEDSSSRKNKFSESDDDVESEEDEEAENLKKLAINGPCKFFPKGKCKKGLLCTYYHESLHNDILPKQTKPAPAKRMRLFDAVFLYFYLVGADRKF